MMEVCRDVAEVQNLKHEHVTVASSRHGLACGDLPCREDHTYSNRVILLASSEIFYHTEHRSAATSASDGVPGRDGSSPACELAQGPAVCSLPSFTFIAIVSVQCILSKNSSTKLSTGTRTVPPRWEPDHLC